MTAILDAYAKVAGEDVVHHLRQLTAPLKGMKVVHVNSTREGGGVAEILAVLVPLMKELGLEARWEVLSGDNDFYQCTKGFHNALQGERIDIAPPLLKAYEDANARNAEALRATLDEADVVFIHDPQPAALRRHSARRTGKWIWRCHIDVSRPHRPVWRYLENYVRDYDASIFSLSAFAQPLPHVVYLIPPSIDPLSEKNMELPREEIERVCGSFHIDPNRPMMLQVSRYDRFKDPLGVMHAYRLAKEFIPALQLVLAGGGAADDPEGEAVLAEVQASAGDDPDIHVLRLPADSHRTINALQRAGDFVLQKSLREGFGLTVTEAMWKAKPVIGGNTGGIRLQVINHHTGFLVDTPEGAALRIRYLHYNRDICGEMGRKAKAFTRDNFLITRQLREYLTVMVALTHGSGDRIELH